MEYYITERISSSDDFAKSLEYIIPGSTISVKSKSDKFLSLANGFLCEGFYLGHNLTENLDSIEIQNSQSCIFSIPSKGNYTIRLSHQLSHTCSPQTGGLILPTESIRYSGSLEEINDLMLITRYEELKPILESKYNIHSIKEESYAVDKRNEKTKVLFSLIVNNLQVLNLYPHLRESLHFKLSIKEVAKILLSEIIADISKVDFDLWRSPDPAILKKAEELMAANPEELFSIHQIADKVCTSPRNLQLTFKKYRDYSPMQFLRERKLNRARAFLIDPGSDTSVKKAAFDSGFLNLSSFSRHYHRLFGELPSETLQSAKRRAGTF